jgi:4-alpha-glucanotransferase
MWAHQQILIFDLMEACNMLLEFQIPRLFQRQVWGHPLYDWKTEAKIDDLLSFWKIRIRYMATLYDSIRFDYAEAFFHYGVMDPEDEENDRTAQGPGALVFEELTNFARGCGLTIFVEDSGAKTEEMRQSLRDLSCSGIRILRFAIDEKKDTVHEEFARVSSYTPLVTAFTSTHDTETLLGFIQLLSVEQKHTLAKYVDVTCDGNDKVCQKLRDAVIHSSYYRDYSNPRLVAHNRADKYPRDRKAVDDPNWNFTLTTPIENLPTHF